MKKAATFMLLITVIFLTGCNGTITLPTENPTPNITASQNNATETIFNTPTAEEPTQTIKIENSGISEPTNTICDVTDKPTEQITVEITLELTPEITAPPTTAPTPTKPVVQNTPTATVPSYEMCWDGVWYKHDFVWTDQWGNVYHATPLWDDLLSRYYYKMLEIEEDKYGVNIMDNLVWDRDGNAGITAYCARCNPEKDEAKDYQCFSWTRDPLIYCRDDVAEILWNMIQDYRVENGKKKDVWHEESAAKAAEQALENVQHSSAAHGAAAIGAYNSLIKQTATPQEIATELFTQWKESPMHNANMLADVGQYADYYEQVGGTYAGCAVYEYIGGYAAIYQWYGWY